MILFFWRQPEAGFEKVAEMGTKPKLDQGNEGGLTLAGGWKVLAGVVGLALDLAVK